MNILSKTSYYYKLSRKTKHDLMLEPVRPGYGAGPKNPGPDGL